MIFVALDSSGSYKAITDITKIILITINNKELTVVGITKITYNKNE